MKINIIGAGLAGCEAALQLADAGFDIRLIDMKPVKKSPAHTLDEPAEIVCSNSLGAQDLSTASGLLKKELQLFDSFLLKAAYESKVKAGRALAVDKKIFSGKVQQMLKKYDIEVKTSEITDFPVQGPVIYATGPLTSEKLAGEMLEFFGKDKFYFYDAIAPVIERDSINMERAFIGGRYQDDGGDYINCPFTEKEYENFYYALIEAEKHPLKDFEKKKFFESCMPIEEIASRGFKTPVFGPMRPVGFEHYIDYKPYAVLQLRKENREGSLYNMVGFQTNLKFGEQKRVFRLIPGLERAEFTRLGRMHKNIYINAPKKLDRFLRVKGLDRVMLAGQITGVEGYLESIFTGLYSAFYIICTSRDLNMQKFNLPPDTMTGALIKYITSYEGKNFQPMNANFGILPKPEKKIKDKKVKKTKMAQKALESLQNFLKEVEWKVD
ncbi:MAG: methylenetetrahydrofolate--tRNA-(uracil(54)-C(5))-methyltransferase (FADH(2)-oxidizing) TrmFO [Candidatus Muiribacteriota bacterium]